MKIVVVGLGQCGSRVADEFARMGKRAHRERRVEIVTDAFAVNTDAADLSGLSCIKSDYRHRILIGGRKTSGHGVGKINEVAAEIAKADADKVIEAIRVAKRFYESDAFLLVASTAGGTGSGSIPVITSVIKQRYSDKPVYVLLVLPFEHEKQTEHRTIYNTATCLKSVNDVADAVFLVDNQRYIKKDSSLKSNMTRINKLMVEPFYDFFAPVRRKRLKILAPDYLMLATLCRLCQAGQYLATGNRSCHCLAFPLNGSVTSRGKALRLIRESRQWTVPLVNFRSNVTPKIRAGRYIYCQHRLKK